MLDQENVAHGVSAEMQALDRSLAMIIFAPNGTIRRANANFLALFGFKARDIVGKHHSIFVPRHILVEEAYGAFWESLRQGEFHSAEYPRLRKDGSQIWIRATYTPVADSEGHIVEVVKFATDVTMEKLQVADDRGQIIAINTSQSVVHFALDGTITGANEPFLRMMDFAFDEVVGAHHRIFIDPAEAASREYQTFWSELAKGRHQAGEYRRVAKSGRDVWLQATYNPIFDMNGEPFKVVKYATDVTREKMRRADHEGQIAAIHKSHGVITFDMNGTVIEANECFLDAVGYRLDEVEGRHHRIFVDPSYAHGPEYATFWSNLAEGRHQAGEYKRFGKDGREVWLQASYNPVQDLNGQFYKVVKYATVVTREKLRQADHQGQIASIHKAQCVVSFDLDGNILDANDNFLDATGYRLAEVRGRHHRIFVDAATAQSDDYRAFWAGLARGRYHSAEFKRLCKDGREIWLQASYNPIFDMNGRPFKVVKYAVDITQERLRQADHEGQIAAIGKSQCVVAFDMNGVVVEVNDNFLEAMGYRRDEIEGRHHRLFVDESYGQSEEYKAFWDTLRSGLFLSEKFRRIGKGGREVWIQASYNPIFDLNGRPFKVVKIATDITADVALAANFVDARRQAEQDAATALPNRAGLGNFMRSVLGGPDNRLALLYLDLDHFKPINDTFGHHVGDHVLRETASRLKAAIQPDQIVARVGGDEFVVAAPDLSDEEIDTLCQRLIDAVKAPIRHDNCMLAVGLSIGVAVSPSDATTADDLLRCADVALYRSKGNGRGGYSFFAEAMNQRMSENRHMADEMRHGIKAGQFFLEYQPRFNARTRTVQGVEALVRWTHPERGRIEPADFISLAEKSGLIVPLGEWVLRNACHAAGDWPDLVVSVNVSPVQFLATDFVHVVEAILAETGLAPERLELEITERMLIEDVERSRAGLAGLKSLGVRLALQDFGTAHASLESLRSFPFDAVKIDRRFIADIEGEEGGRRIVQDILRLGKALGVSVTAEGVETTGQLLMLNLDDCAEVQGYLLSRPLSSPELAILLGRQAAAAARASRQTVERPGEPTDAPSARPAEPRTLARRAGRRPKGEAASAAAG